MIGPMFAAPLRIEPPPALPRGAMPRSLVVFAGFGEGVDREIEAALLRQGVKGLWMADAGQALAAAAHARFDAAVLKLDGRVASAARQIGGWRSGLGCPLLLLAPVEDEVDEILALELGADAVLAPPVSARRLRAHLQRLLRRPGPDEPAMSAPWPAAPEAAGLPSRCGPWTLDRVHNRLCGPGHRVELSEVLAALLQQLMDEAGRVVPRSRLLAAVPRGKARDSRTIDVYVSRLRARLAAARVDGLQVECVRGRGYALSWAEPARSWHDAHALEAA